MSWPDTDWVPPWTPGLPHKACATCLVVVVAVTLDEFGECRKCALARPGTWAAQQLRLTA